MALVLAHFLICQFVKNQIKHSVPNKNVFSIFFPYLFACWVVDYMESFKKVLGYDWKYQLEILRQL